MEFNPIPGQLAHFSINADDVARAQKFYSAVFGWSFLPFGPPGFFMIQTTPEGASPAPVLASLQGRRQLDGSDPVRGLEGTIAVADVDATAKAVEAAGGRITLPRCTLPGVGHLIYFADTEGNLLGAMQYDSAAE